MQQPLAYIFQTLNLHEVFRNGNTERRLAFKCCYNNTIILNFQFFNNFIFFAQNGKIVERLGLLAIQQ
jgi:hypothetical protein